MFNRASMMIRHMAQLLVMTLLVAPVTAEEIKVRIGGEMGIYLPMTYLHDQYENSESLSFRHRPGPVYAAYLDFWISDRYVVELHGSHASSNVEYRLQVGSLDTGDLIQAASRSSVEVNLLYNAYKPLLSNLDGYLLVGGGLVFHGGDYFDHETLTDTRRVPALNVGVGCHYGLRERLYMRVELKNALSFYRAADRFESMVQHDVTLSLGFEWSLTN